MVITSRITLLMSTQVGFSNFERGWDGDSHEKMLTSVLKKKNNSWFLYLLLFACECGVVARDTFLRCHPSGIFQKSVTATCFSYFYYICISPVFLFISTFFFLTHFRKLASVTGNEMSLKHKTKINWHEDPDRHCIHRSLNLRPAPYWKGRLISLREGVEHTLAPGGDLDLIGDLRRE